MLIAGSDNIAAKLETINLEGKLEEAIGVGAYQLLGVIGFAVLGILLYRTAMKKHPEVEI